MLTLKIAFRNLFRQKRRTLLSAAGLLGAYVLLSFSESLTEGSYANIIAMFTRDRTGHVQIHRKGYLDRPNLNRTLKKIEPIEKVLKAIPDIRAYSLRIHGPALAYGNTKTSPVQVVGVDPLNEPRVTVIREKIKAGQFFEIQPKTTENPTGILPCLVGVHVLENLKLKLGDELILISQGADGSTANERFLIQGVVGTADSQDSSTVYLTLEGAQSFYTLENQVHEIAISLSHHDQAIHAADVIRERLRLAEAELPGALDVQELSVDPWQVVEEEFYRGMMVDQKGNKVSYGIILFIAAIGILNVVLMSLLERTREFGVLKAIGVRPSRLFQLILLETLLLSLMSVGIGTCIAIPLIGWFEKHGIRLDTPIEMGGISYDRMVAQLSFGTVFGPALLVILVSLGVAMIPAWRAVRIRPVDALRSH